MKFYFLGENSVKFIEKHSDYKLYKSDEYYVNEIPRELIEPLKGLIIGHSEDVHELKRFVAIIAKYIPCSPSENWGWNWVLTDLDDYIWKLFKKNKFNKFMDCLADLGAELNDLEELNEILNDVNVGYFLEFIPFEGHVWHLTNSIENYAATLDESLEVLPSIFESSREHLEQAKIQLSQSDKSSRARKDALRDCISALEALLKQVSAENDFRASVKKLSEEWDSKAILRDATSIWSYIHDEKPDVRHGNPELIELPIEDTIYYIDRINALIKFICMKAE